MQSQVHSCAVSSKLRFDGLYLPTLRGVSRDVTKWISARPSRKSEAISHPLLYSWGNWGARRGMVPARDPPGSNSRARAGWSFLGLQCCSFSSKEKFSICQGCRKIGNGTVTLESTELPYELPSSFLDVYPRNDNVSTPTVHTHVHSSIIHTVWSVETTQRMTGYLQSGMSVQWDATGRYAEMKHPCRLQG